MHSKIPFLLLLFGLLGLNLAILLTAFLASEAHPIAKDMYMAFSPTCHQLTSRSLCLFKHDLDGTFSIGDCLPVSTFSPSKVEVVFYPDKTAFKFPVCSRDMAIYFFMLLAVLLLPVFQKIETTKLPPKLVLIAAAVPIAIDGVGQLFALWESTNLVRIATGGLIGFVMPFYILPIANTIYETGLKLLFKKKRN
ncbi:MAG: DUF2085 domain-containing protein [Candidatus Anstonellaceae archaeon]